MNDICVAAVVSKSIPGEIAKNLENMEKFLKIAQNQQIDLICFPELSISGYATDRSFFQKAVHLSDIFLTTLLDIGKKYSIAYLAGVLEKGDDDQIFASHLFVNPHHKKDQIQDQIQNSNKIRVYRKIHIPHPEKSNISPGKSIPTFQYKETRFGVQLCFDAHFPELSSKMANDGVDVIFFPHASPQKTNQSKIKSWLRHLPARAFDNSVFVVACNMIGQYGNNLKFPGVAIIVGPDGNLIAQYDQDEEGILKAQLHAKSVSDIRNSRMRYFLPHKRFDLYGI